MPFIDIVKKPQDLSNFEIETPLDDPTLSETFGAAFRTQNMVGSFLSQRGAVDPNEEEAGFNAIDYIKDDSRYAPYADEFAGLSNRRSADAMKMQIDREEADRRTLDAAGWTGIVAQMAAGVFDLPTLLPFGGAIAGASRSGALVGGAIGAGMDAAVSEAGLQATQATRTGTESALNIGGSIVLGGALGALAGRYLNSVSQLSLSRKIERQGDEFDALDREFAAAGSVGAAERDRGPLVLKDEALISKLPLVSRQDPMIRLQLGELDAGRETVRRMAETPLEYADNAKGVATERGGSVETRIKMWSAPLAKTVREMDVEFAKYYHGTPEPTSWQRRLSPTLSEFDRFRGGKKLTYKQFKEEVGRAAYMGGEHEIPEVAAAAKAYRAIDEQLKNAAIEAKLFPEDVSVEGDISHRFRMYNKEKIIADRGTFKQRLVDYFTAGQESAGFRAEENALGQKIIEADRLREKYDASFGRLAGLEERLNARLNVRQRKMSDVERARQTRFDVMKERAPADLVKALRGADQNAAMIDTVKEFRKAVRESKKANPKFADKYPVLARIKERGGVTKGSMLHHELSMMDVTPKKFPGLFVENGGIGELDNFVKSEYDEFANLASDGSYVDRNALYDAIREELSGRPLKSADELAAQDLADNLEGVVREWMDKVGLDANATVKDIRDFIDRVNGAEKDVAGLDTKIYNLEKEIEDFDKATDGLRNEQLISTQEAATIADELNKLEEALNEVEIAERPMMDNIGGEMAKRFEAAGRSKEEATAAARLVEDFYVTTAQRMGVDPDTLMKDFGLPEVRGPKDAITGEGAMFQSAPATETEAFRRWFGDSKVVDADGKPMVVYHGAGKDFESFSTDGGKGKTFGTGAFFSSSKDVANTYAVGAQQSVYPVYLSLKNPVVVDASGLNWNSIGGKIKASLPKEIVSRKSDNDLLAELGIDTSKNSPTETLKPKQTTVKTIFKDGWFNGDTVSTDDIARWAKSQGYESLIIKNVKDRGPSGAYASDAAKTPSDIYVAFSPEQIKSVNNRGTFDPNDARILFQADEQFADLAAQKALAKKLFDGLKENRDPNLVNEAFAQVKKKSGSQNNLIAELIKNDDGLELTNSNGMNAAITRSQDKDGGWRVTFFSENGFFGHTEQPTKEAAVRQAITEGYDQESVGALRTAMKSKTFFQKAKRGSIQFGDNGKTVISLFENADKSTALHETGHYFLGAFKSLAEKDAAPKAIKADWESVKGWWSANADAVAKDSGMEGVTGADVRAVLETGSSGDASIDAAIDVGLHEQWARAFEAYLRDGVAPNAGLRGVFKQFKDWLTRVYKQAKDLNVELSPELRGVFDRLLGDSPEGSMRGSKADMANASPRVGVIVDYAKTKRDLFKAKLEERNLSKRVDALQKMEAEGRLNDDMLAELSAKSVDLDRVGKKIQTLTAKANKLEPMAPTKAQVAKTDEFANLMPGEIESLADETINQILGHAEGRVPYDIVSGPRGALKERLLKIETAKIHDFVENDIEHVLNSQVRTMSADIELSKKFGSVDLKEEIRKVNDEADAKISKAETPEQRQAIEKSRVNTIRDISDIRDRLRGAFALPSDPTSIVLRAGRVARNLNYVRLLGGMTVSAIPDMGSIVFQHGLVSTFRDGFIPLVINFKAFRMAAEEVKAAGTALDMVLDTRTMAMADVFDNMGRGSKFERAISAGSNRFGLVSLMAPWNATLKQVAGLVTMTRILNVAKRVTDGTATADDIRRLAASGIDDDLAKRIAAQFEAHGDTQGGVLLAKGEAWTDKDALEAFRSAVVRDVDKTIVTPGQDKPTWMSTELGKSVGQFKTFGVSAMQKIALSGLQQRDATTLNGAVLMLGLGAMSYAAKETLAGRPLSEDPAQWAVEAFDKSGLAGWLMEVNNIAEKATRGRVGLSAFTGKQVSRYASRNVVGAFLGPTADAVSDIFQISGSIFAGDTTQADLRKFRQLLPMQNLFYIRGLLNQVEQSTGQALGLPETRQ